MPRSSLSLKLLSARAATLFVPAVVQAVAFVDLQFSDHGFVELFLLFYASRIAVAFLDGSLKARSFIAHALLEGVDTALHARISIAHRPDGWTHGRILGPRALWTRCRQSEEGRSGDTRGNYVFG